MASVYVVSYDLRKVGRNYQGLYDRLAEWKAVRGLESAWFITWENTSSQTIRDDLKQKLDANDGLFVAKLSGQAAWHELEGNSGSTLKKWIEGG